MIKDRLEERIFTYSSYLKSKYGRKIFRLGLSTGVVCPHRSVNGGCIFCNPDTFRGDYQSVGNSIKKQLEIAIPIMQKSCGDVDFLAYFQDETSTAGSLNMLRKKFSEALANKKIVGLVISTRPDYLNADIISLLQDFNIPVTVEIGLQSIHDRSLYFLERGHNFTMVDKAISLCGEAGLNVGVHLLIGIPDETKKDMLLTLDYITKNKYIKQAKLHNLVVYKNTRLAEMLRKGDFEVITLNEYIDLLPTLIAHIRGNITLSRLFTSNIKRNQIAIGEYKGNKPIWLNEIRKRMIAADLVQGQFTDIIYDPKDIKLYATV